MIALLWIMGTLAYLFVGAVIAGLVRRADGKVGDEDDGIYALLAFLWPLTLLVLLGIGLVWITKRIAELGK